MFLSLITEPTPKPLHSNSKKFRYPFLISSSFLFLMWLLNCHNKRAKKKVPFAPIWLWFHWSWVRWIALLETSDILWVVAAPLSKLRWTNLPGMEVETLLWPFLYLRKYFGGLTLLFDFEVQLPIVTTILTTYYKFV